MKKNIFKIILIMVITLLIIIGTMYLIDLNKMQKGQDVVFSTWGKKYAPVLKINKNSVEEEYKEYSKTIDNVRLELYIPNDWNYKEVPKNEENEFYKYSLKLYKNNEEKYAMIYFYNNQFGVCGTGRTSKDIILNNGQGAIVGYYDGNKNWSDISFYSMNKNIAVMNYGLINDEAAEVIEFIKTINIIENYEKEN